MKKYILKLKLTGILLVFALIKINAQSNLQIVFHSYNTYLQDSSIIYMYAGAGIDNPGNHWQYTVGNITNPGVGLMTNIGPYLWGICLEPYTYFSQGPAGAIQAGHYIYNIDMLFHNSDFSVHVDSNFNFYPFNLTTTQTIPPVLTSNNSPGQIDATFQNCTLGIQDIQITNGLIGNYPNPLVEKTTFLYSIKSAGKVTLKIYNTIGQVVKTIVNNEFQSPKTYTYKWSGDNDIGRKLFNGIYYYTLSVNNKAVQTNKLIISR
ncbi:MAG: T9SS type A sorting domain-containing protein [Bacteroidota bacterium]